MYKNTVKVVQNMFKAQSLMPTVEESIYGHSVPSLYQTAATKSNSLPFNTLEKQIELLVETLTKLNKNLSEQSSEEVEEQQQPGALYLESFKSTQLDYAPIEEEYNTEQVETIDEDSTEFILNKIYISDLTDIIVQEAVDVYSQEINWEELCKSYTINSTFIERFQKFIHWEQLSKNTKIMDNDYYLIEKFGDQIGWDNISSNVCLTEEFIEKYEDKIDWDSIIKNSTFTENLIEKYSDKINWEKLGDFIGKLSLDFIRKHFHVLKLTKQNTKDLFKKLRVKGYINTSSLSQTTKLRNLHPYEVPFQSFSSRLAASIPPPSLTVQPNSAQLPVPSAPVPQVPTKKPRKE